MKRERIAWSISLLLLTLVAFRLSPTLAHRDDDYAFVRTLVDIHRQVAVNYVDPVDEQRMQQAAVDGMLAQLDPFSTYVPPSKTEDFDRMLEGTFKGVGVQLNQLDNGKIEVVTPIEGSPAHKAGVLAGDIILKVNGESIEGLRIADVIKKIGGDLGTDVSLTVWHTTGQEQTLTMQRGEITVPVVKGYLRKNDAAQSWDYFVCEDPKIGYLRITQFTPGTSDVIRDILKDILNQGMKGFILDLRFNPGGQLDQAVKIVNLFVKEGTIVVTKGRNRAEDVKQATPGNALSSTFPMIVLVNEHSASASEIVAGSLLDNKRAVVMGTRTYGKGSVQELIRLEGNGELKLTVAYYYLPSGRLVHKKKDAKDWGVEPQIIVPMDEEAQRKMQKDRYDQDLYRRVSTAPSANGALNPTSKPSDVQLQRAIDTMLATLLFERNRLIPAAAPMAGPTTAPTSQPAQ